MKKQAFTMVELIVVITILAILGTIAFINFQGYSGLARDSKRLNDVTDLFKIISLGIVNGIEPSDVMKNGVDIKSGLNIGGNTPLYGKQGTINFPILKQSESNFKDPNGDDYIFSFVVGEKSTGIGYRYMQLATISEVENKAVVIGDYRKKEVTDSESLIFSDPSNLSSSLVINNLGVLPLKFNSPPIAPTINLITLDQNVIMTPITLPIFSDAEMDSIIYSINGLPSGIVFNNTTRVISGNPAISGDFTLTYSANDGRTVSSVNVLISVKPDLWTWNTEHTLGCKRNTLSKVECKWEGLDINTSLNVNLNINNINCPPLTSNKLIGPFIIERNNDINRCGYNFTDNSNILQLSYTDSNGVSKKTTNTLNLPLGLFTLDSNAIIPDITGFNFDLSNVSIEIDKEYSFYVKNASGSTISSCNKSYSGSTRTGRIDLKDNCGGSNFGKPFPNSVNTIITLVDNVNKQAYSQPILKKLATLDINNPSYFTSTSVGFNYNFSSSPQATEIYGILNDSNYGGFQLWIRKPGATTGTYCGILTTISGATNCSWVFNSFASGLTYSAYIKYGYYSSYTFESNRINLIKP